MDMKVFTLVCLCIFPLLCASPVTAGDRTELDDEKEPDKGQNLLVEFSKIRGKDAAKLFVQALKIFGQNSYPLISAVVNFVSLIFDAVFSDEFQATWSWLMEVAAKIRDLHFELKNIQEEFQWIIELVNLSKKLVYDDDDNN